MPKLNWKFNNLNEKLLELVEEIVKECKDWLIEIIQNEQWINWKIMNRDAVTCETISNSITTGLSKRK